MVNETVYSTLSGEDVADVLRELRITPDLRENGVGEPYIKLVAKGRRCQVLFFDCADDKRAGAIQYRATFKAPHSFTQESFVAVSQFNWDSRFVKAVVYDSGTAFLLLDYSAEGGVNRENLKRATQLWLQGLDAFSKHLADEMGITVERESSW